MSASTLSLIVLTLNIAGPRRADPSWALRRDAIVRELEADNADVAAFQEVWRAEDMGALASAAGHSSRAADPRLGVAVTSRRPLESWSARDLGDGAAILRARLRTPQGALDAYSVRLTAGPLKAQRLGQIFLLAEFVRAESANVPFVLLGDLAEGAEEHDATLLLDLLEARDLCVSHGDEICGRTFGDQRTDYALIPYTSRSPRERARTAFIKVPANDEADGVTAHPHFGLRATLDSSFMKLRLASAPAGRQEALGAILSAVEEARLDAAVREQKSGWIPFLGTRQSLELRAEVATLAALEEKIHSAQLHAAAREPFRN